MKLILPVAGAGMRCRPWSAVLPKPLLPVANRPMLAHVLDDLLPLDPEEIILVTGWLGDQIETWTRAAYPRLPLCFIRQDRLLGQSHAVLQAREHLAGEGLIVFPDMLFRLGTDPFAAIAPEIDAAIFTTEVADRANFAIAQTGPDGIVRQLVEKPRQPMAGDAVIGMYWLRDLARLGAVISGQIAQGRAAPNGEFALADAIGSLISEGARILPIRVEEWIGAGSNASLLAANRWALDRAAVPGALPSRPGSDIIPPCAIDPSAIIEASVIGPWASIGAGAVVRRSRVRNAIVGEGAVVEDCSLDGAIVSRDTRWGVPRGEPGGE
jgi:glucose-1-phosphate thymidylyltransferase